MLHGECVNDSVNKKYLGDEENLNIFWINFVLILIAISAPWINHTVSGHELIKSYFSYCGMSFLVLISLYYKTNYSDLRFSFNFLKLSLILLFTLGTCSIFWTANFDLTINKLLLWFTALLSFVVANNLSISTTRLLNLSWGLIIAAGFIAIIGIIQHLFDPFTLTQYALPASTFGNRNIATQPLILIAPVFLFLILSRHSQGIKVWTISIITSFIFIYLFYTTSRGAWLSVFAESILIIAYFLYYKLKKYSWIDWNKNKRNAVIFGLFFILFMCSFSSTGYVNVIDLTSQEVVSITGSVNNLSSEAVSESNVESWRYEIWKTAINMFKSSPWIGTGLGSYSHNLANEGFSTWLINNTFRVHNDLLELAVEIGLIGILTFAVVVILIVLSIINILKNTKGELHFFYYIIFVALVGSFCNLQFSFPYQMPFPVLLFGIYCGLISKKLDDSSSPIMVLNFSVLQLSKKIGLIILGIILTLTFYFTYFSWIKVYHQLNKVNLLGDFSQINIVETPIYNSRMQNILYTLGGNYFLKGRYIQSNAIDEQFLKFWPNQLDVLYRYAYSLHKLGQNDKSLQLSKKLKELEPQGLYNSFIVDMFVFSSLKETSKLEETFNELLTQPETFLKLNDDTYRFLMFFSLGSKNLLKNTEELYQKYVEYHGYNCEVTNNMAIYYFNLEDFETSAEYVKLAHKKDFNKPKCLNPTLVKLLKEKNLINPKVEINN